MLLIIMHYENSNGERIYNNYQFKIKNISKSVESYYSFLVSFEIFLALFENFVNIN